MPKSNEKLRLIMRTLVPEELDLVCDALEGAGIPFQTKRIIPRSIRNTLAYYAMSTNVYLGVLVPETDFESAKSLLSELPINPATYLDIGESQESESFTSDKAMKMVSFMLLFVVLSFFFAFIFSRLP